MHIEPKKTVVRLSSAHISSVGRADYVTFAKDHAYGNPCRVKAPLKRTNKKKCFDVGPGWVEIRWEEAHVTVADVYGPFVREKLENIEIVSIFVWPIIPDPRVFMQKIAFSAGSMVASMQSSTELNGSQGVIHENAGKDVHLNPIRHRPHS